MDIIKLNGQAGASSTNGKQYAAANAFKPEEIKPWANQKSNFPAMVWFEFFSNVHLNRISFTSRREERLLKQAPETFNIVASNDGKNWQELLHVESAGFSAGGQTMTWDVPCNNAFFKFVGVDVSSPKSGAYTAITNITMWGQTQEGNVLYDSMNSRMKFFFHAQPAHAS